LTRGISLRELSRRFGEDSLKQAHLTIAELVEDGLIELRGDFVALTSRGRLLSNEVFERFIGTEESVP
jgi:oxygen-independent coproporphyrinogen-3 oxidase